MPVHIIGIMSGSSLDGLDMAFCRLDATGESVRWELLQAQTVSFPAQLQSALQNASSLSGFDLMKLDADFGIHIGNEAKKWIDLHNLNADFIASHGHTVFHEPGLGFTTQIGSGAHIAHATGLDTVTTFRSADVATGGQGAPFAPACDRILFPGFEGYLNLGGIANINLLTQSGLWKAWDIGPCNQALNHLAAKAGKPFDENGNMAATGNVLDHVVDELLNWYPFRAGQPRGLSNAEVQASWIQYLNSSAEKSVDLLASVSEAICQMILNHIHSIIKSPSKILVTGGGAHNANLTLRLKTKASAFDISFQLPSTEVIDYKECLLMAYLGYLTMEGNPYGIKDITGASKESIGGAIFKASR